MYMVMFKALDIDIISRKRHINMILKAMYRIHPKVVSI